LAEHLAVASVFCIDGPAISGSMLWPLISWRSPRRCCFRRHHGDPLEIRGGLRALVDAGVALVVTGDESMEAARAATGSTSRRLA
jgi:hypothetical protein